MRGFMVGIIFSFLVIFAPVSTDGHAVHVDESPVTCSSEGVQCDFNEDNLIDAVTNVMTLEACRRICLDNEACQFITYFDFFAAPLSHFCQLFKSCETVSISSNCVSENMDCFRSCRDNVVGDLNKNVLDVVPNVDSEAACKQSCLNTAYCSFYTYFFPNSAMHHNFCFLQTKFVPPVQPCNNCITSSMDCSVECSLTVDGESSKSVMLTDANKWTSHISISGGLLCNLTLLVVGGGGGGYHKVHGGGGSGYHQYRSLQVPAGTLLRAQVGDSGQASSVTFSSGNVTFTVTAQPGQDAQGDNGGDGYSGGGGKGCSRSGKGGRFCDGAYGGTDGGGGEDGKFSSGGHGTGKDVSLYSFTTWSLGPGAGGRPVQAIRWAGGGGGGLQVDGSGPQAKSYQRVGAGYGAGGSWGDGLQGVILIEIN